VPGSSGPDEPALHLQSVRLSLPSGPAEFAWQPRHTLDVAPACLPCSAGTFKPEPGAQVCTFCPSNSMSPAVSILETACTCNAGTSGPDGGTCMDCPADTLKLTSGFAPCFECKASRFATCLCEGSRLAYLIKTQTSVGLAQMLLQLRAETPAIGSDMFFNMCAKSRGSFVGRAESTINCGCFGWGEDGFDAALKDNPAEVLQIFNPLSPWRDIPCYQRRAPDDTEWRHPVDQKTCREVSTQLLSNHHLCDWEYAGYCCECHCLD